MFASKMADLNLSLEPLNRMKSRLCVENGRFEPRFGGLKNIDERFWNRPFGISALRFLLASRDAVSVGSAVCFFVLILNNAPALRAGNQC